MCRIHRLILLRSPPYEVDAVQGRGARAGPDQRGHGLGRPTAESIADSTKCPHGTTLEPACVGGARDAVLTELPAFRACRSLNTPTTSGRQCNISARRVIARSPCSVISCTR